MITHRIELGDFERKEFKETADEVQKILKTGNQALTFARYGLPVAAGVAGAGLAYGLYALAKAFGFAGGLIDDLKKTYKIVSDDVLPTLTDEEFQEEFFQQFKDDPIDTITSPTKAAQDAYLAYRLKQYGQGGLNWAQQTLIDYGDDAMASNTSSWGLLRPFLARGGNPYMGSNGIQNNPQKIPPAGWEYYEPPNFDYNSLQDFPHPVGYYTASDYIIRYV